MLLLELELFGLCCFVVQNKSGSLKGDYCGVPWLWGPPNFSPEKIPSLVIVKSVTIQ